MSILDYCLLYCIVSGIAASAFLWLGNKALENNGSPEATMMLEYINNNQIIFFLVSFFCWPLFIIKGLFMLFSR